MIFLENLRRPLNGNKVHTEQDLYWLKKALELAKKAASEQEVPVGAIVVADNEILGEGYNQPIKSHDPTAHAEIMALRAAAAKIANYRLINTTLYVTLEPCIMCTGAIIHARVKRLVYGAHDPKTGAITNQCQLLNLPTNHKVDYLGGVLAQECGGLLQDFFRAKR